VVFGDGEQSRDFTYVDNAVDATVLAASAESVSGETFNVAYGQRTALNQVLDELGRLAGQRLDARHEDRRPGDVRDSLADITRARESLGYEPSVDVREGLRRTYRHYGERRDSSSSRYSASTSATRRPAE
jgi:UDP-N-acetylglucosamine 4-epimerase